MRVIIVGRDRENLMSLVDKLTHNNFEVIVVDNSSAVLSYIKNGGIQFLLADAPLLVDHGLGREVLQRCPLARLVALAAQPTRLGMVDALAGGLTDYFPRLPVYFDDVLKTLLRERKRLKRWQRILLSDEVLSEGGDSANGDSAEPRLESVDN
jgi:Response regulator containing CheY-like receiver, AAA-type ATPase, and DNA-binding domains